MKDLKKETHIIDVKDKMVGRVAVDIAKLLTGKDKPQFVPYEDMGDFVTIKNVEKIDISGRKKDQKIYYSHSQYMGGLSKVSFEKKFKEDPKSVLLHAVSGMLPKNKLRAERLKRIKFE